MRTPELIRPVYYHLRNEEALAARPKLYRMMLKHWNTESGFIVRTYDDFKQALPVTRYLQSIVGTYATNLIVSFSASLPPHVAPLTMLEQATQVERPNIGVRPEYLSVHTIDATRYAYLSRMPEATLTSDHYWEMQKFQYNQLFKVLSDREKIQNWHLFRDSKRKVLNIKREFQMLVSEIESFSNFRWTIRSEGQDLRARQLSEIRAICKLLRVTTLHAENNYKINGDDLQRANDYVWQNRDNLSKIFEFNLRIDRSGIPYPWLQKKTAARILNNPKLFVMNQLLNA